ncbi:MAG: porin [Bacteroidota bacterium]
MKRIATVLAISIAMLLPSGWILGQGSGNYGSGLKLKLNENGSKYARFITWHQMWLTVQDDANGDLSTVPMLRRSRMLMFAQISPRFLINTHFGLNNLTAAGLHPTGQSSQSQLFMHDAWAEYTVIPKKLSIGGGLHYWNGISRLTSQSTLNMMTLDAPRFNWATLGLSDQFARHLGIYFKGQIGRLDYRLSINEAMQTTLDDNVSLENVPTVYQNDGGKVYSGYLSYQFLDKEGNTLPYYVGSYLGTKRVFNLGAGFNLHPEGTTSLQIDSSISRNNVRLLAVDAFYDHPLGENGSALTAYAVWYNYDFGPNYLLQGTSDVIGTGNIVYGSLGYLLPNFSEKIKIQPYLQYSHRRLEAQPEAASTIGIGANGFLDGHNCKVTIEYQNRRNPLGVRSGRLITQAMIYL